MKKTVQKIIYVIVIIGCFIYLNQNEIKRFYDHYIDNHKVELKNLSKDEFFQIQFIDVGQGESIFIENNKKYVLVDAGNNKDGNKLVKYFQELGIDSFQYVIGTHAHEDHIGGMDNIIRTFPINHYYMPSPTVDNMTYQGVIKALQDKNIKLETPNIDSTFQVENTKFQILSITDDEEDLNNTSIILKVSYYNTTFLLMSDATEEIERNLLEKDINSDVLKVSHHGSKYSSIAQFINKVHPKYAIIQVGKNNDYYFPHKVTLDKLERIGSKIYRTDLNGTIIITSNGNDLQISTKKTDTNQE